MLENRTREITRDGIIMQIPFLNLSLSLALSLLALMAHAVNPIRISGFSSRLRRSMFVLCLSQLFALGLGVEVARAQSDGETEVARQRFREGVGHYDRQEYDKARLAFLQAYLLKPHPAVLLNLAQSELRAGRHAEAAENFAKYIRQNPTAPAMEHAKAAFEEARQKVAELNLEVSAVGAVVSVDGSEVGRSPLPNVIYLMPGRHTIAARKGGLSADRSLEAVAGQRVYVTLELQGGSGSSPALGAAAASDGDVTQIQGEQLAREPAMDTGPSQGFFSWMANSPAAIATVTVAGVALGTSAVLAGFANNRYAVANDVRERIMVELQNNVDEGVLVATAVPCGEGGIANGVGSFDSRIPQDQVEGLVSDYANACRLFSERSDSGDRLKTLSLVSLGVGAFATVGTIVWYFSDTGSSGSDSAKADVASKRRTSISPILTPDTQGVWLNVSF